MRQCGKWKTPVRKFRQINGSLLPRSFVPRLSIRYWMVMQDRTAREPGAAGGRYFSVHRGSTAFGARGSLQRPFRDLQPVTAAVRAALGIVIASAWHPG
jgi:hypothetical protein